MSLKNPVTPPGIDPGTFRLVAQRLNHYATPGPLHDVYMVKFTYTPLQIHQLNVHIYLYNNTFITLLLHVSVCCTSSGRATCISAQNHMVTCVIKKLVLLSRNTSSPPEDGVYHSRNVVNILLYKYMCEFSWYI